MPLPPHLVRRSCGGPSDHRCDRLRLCHRNASADQPGACHRFWHDAHHQLGPWRVHGHGQLQRRRRRASWRQHLGGHTRRCAGRGRDHRRHPRTADHPQPLRPHGRDDAGDLGPEPVYRRHPDDDFRRHHRRHADAVARHPHRRLPDQRLQLVRHRFGRGHAVRRLRDLCVRAGWDSWRAGPCRMPRWPPRSAPIRRASMR